MFLIIFLMFYGVTLLAFGNGASDVLSAFAAGGDQDAEVGIYLSLGSILGSCFFVTMVVSSMIILFIGHNVKVFL